MLINIVWKHSELTVWFICQKYPSWHHPPPKLAPCCRSSINLFKAWHNLILFCNQAVPNIGVDRWSRFYCFNKLYHICNNMSIIVFLSSLVIQMHSVLKLSFSQQHWSQITMFSWLYSWDLLNMHNCLVSSWAMFYKES